MSMCLSTFKLGLRSFPLSSSSFVLRPYGQAPASRWAPWVQAWLPVLLFAMVFAVESTPYFGSDHTNVPLRRAAEALFGSGVDAGWAGIHHLIRKTGHVVGYGMFALVCFRGFWLVGRKLAARFPRKLWAHGLAILVTFLVAGADEFHQSFLPNRAGQFSDVLLDTCGAAMLCLLLFLAMCVLDWRMGMQAKAVRREPVYVE